MDKAALEQTSRPETTTWAAAQALTGAGYLLHGLNSPRDIAGTLLATLSRIPVDPSVLGGLHDIAGTNGLGVLWATAEIAGAGVVVSRIAGISLIALGMACWPVRGAKWAPCGTLTYSLLATLYRIYLSFGGKWAGKLLWPAVALHAVLTILVALAWFNKRKNPGVNA